MRLFLNKKGDIPITILVIGVVSVCIFTLYSFIFSINQQSESFIGAGIIETIYSAQEEMWLDKSLNLGQYSDNQLFELRDSYGAVNLNVDRTNKIINGNYTSQAGKWIFKKDKVLLDIEYKYSD